MFGLMALLLTLLLAWFFREAIKPDYSTFNNDTPLGVMHSAWVDNLGAVTGVWQDSNWLGNAGVAAVPNATRLFLGLVGPLYYSKFYAAFSLLFVGLSAWFCFRKWNFAAPVCVLGGLATVLHGDFFPNSCWGVGSQVIGFGLNFLALGALADENPRTRWASVVLAGFAVGLGVTEAFDIGALFSLAVAAFVVWQALNRDGGLAKNFVVGGIRLALVAGCAALIAAGIVTSLIGTQVKGISGMAQDEASKAQRWTDATMWSTPPSEAIGVLVPALYGFRMDTPQGGEYWGRGGRAEGWDRYLAGGPVQPGDVVRVQLAGSAQLSQPQRIQIAADGKLTIPGIAPIAAAGLMHTQLQEQVKSALAQAGPGPVAFQVELPNGFIKYGGGGGYAGAVVLVLALWGVFQSLRRTDSALSTFQKRMVWFWCAVAAIALLLSFGRFAPFYWWFYQLPYASTIRIPGKFGHIFAWATLILFAYGAQALWIRYIASAPATTRGWLEQWRVWWSKVGEFERRWIVGGGLVFVLAVAGCGVYAMNRAGVEAYIAKLNFYETITQGGKPDAEAAAAAAKAQMNFSLRQAAKAVFFFGASLGLVAVCLTGYFGGVRWKIAAGLFAALILAELGPASAPWVITYNWKEKYIDAATNPVIEKLRERPFENRVAILSGTLRGVQLGILEGVYGGDWKQHLFQYYNIQTIDIVQMPRVPTEVQMWESALFFNGSPEALHVPWRRWELMNVRYLLAGAGMAESLNQQLKPNAPFRELMRFDFYQARQGGPILTRTGGDAQYALIEYTGALPRAKLYTHWQVSTNDETTLQTLRNSEFDPAATVLVADSIAPAAGTNTNAGTVEFASYAPKKILLKAKATAPSVLLLNDKHDTNWKVYVDGQSKPLLRCNFVMRGVQVPAGDHAVEFRYEPPRRMLYVSLTATAMLVALLGYVSFVRGQTAT